MKTLRITVFEDSPGSYRWRLYARNGKPLAESTESYKRRASALASAQKVADRSQVITVGVED